MSRQVCDANVDESTWIDVDEPTDRDAVLTYLATTDLDPAEVAAVGSFEIHVRDDARDEPRKVRVEGVAARWRVGGR